MTGGGPRPIDGSTRVAAVLGWPVTHSRSPALHNAGFAAAGLDAVLVALPVAPADLPAAVAGLAALGVLGASVTVPHKQAAAALCDRLVEPAARIGAVNCLAFADGQVIGHNTDASGFVDGLADAGLAPPARAVIVGGGGAARAVAAGLTDAGSAVAVVARRPDAVAWIEARPWAELGDALAGAELLVDATSAGLDPERDRALSANIPLERLPDRAGFATLIYHRPTALATRAAAAGHPVVDGRAMLLHQAARAFTIWTGRDPPLDAMRAALDASLT